MKFELKGYQETAASQVLRGLRKASRDWADPHDREHGAVSLAAPTGAGKTVIAAAVIEHLWFGNDNTEDPAPADPNATFLWLTDDPSLNAQTRKKIREASERIQPGQLVTIDEGFDQPAFDPGKVYFLNTQKLGRKANYVNRREGVRKHTLWETMANTINSRGGNYYVIIDEAHRGTGNRSGKASKEQQTLAARVIHGDGAALPPAPVVWGISATPQRFHDALAAATPKRTLREVVVPVADVRDSGLLKDHLGVRFAGEKQTMTATLLADAMANIIDMDTTWKAYTDAEGDPDVKPILVLQIPDENTMSTDDVGVVLDEARAAWPELVKHGAVRHSLGDHVPVKFGAHVVDYIEPQNIQDNPKVRLVIAKEALTTGWDCPRAETMVSLRTARDVTYIAQLVGRMVRTPLARRVGTVDALNRVTLFLPHFDRAAVNAVVDNLTSDPDGPAGAVDVLVNPVDVGRNADVPPEVFDIFTGLPSYVVPGALHKSQVARLRKLAALLAGDKIVEKATSQATIYLIGALEAERARLDGDGTLAALLADVATATTAAMEVDIHSGEASDATDVVLDVTDRDLDAEMVRASRVFRDGLADDYWAHLVNGGKDPRDAKILVAALARAEGVKAAVENAAEARVGQWLTSHLATVEATLSDDRQDAYRQVQAATRAPERVALKLPDTRTMPGEGAAFAKHLFADGSGDFRPNCQGWESTVLDVELGRGETVAWYRNPTGGHAGLRVPYANAGAASGFSPMYPDFVFFTRDVNDQVAAHIVDPHGHHLADAPAKLKGLADYAEKHGDGFGRIIGVIKGSDDVFYQLNLKNPNVRQAVAGVSDKASIEALFLELGSKYS